MKYDQDTRSMTSVPAYTPPRIPMQRVWKGQYSYQELFNAIAESTSTSGVAISISVKAFEDAMRKLDK